MPAQNKRKRKRIGGRIGGKKNTDLRKYSYITFFILVFLVYFYIKFTSEFWNGKTKLMVVYPKIDGDVETVMFDGFNEEIVVVTVPGDAQVDVAYNLGLWRLKSVWKLGENEGLGGELLATSMIKHFKFPVDVWSDEEFRGIVEGNALHAARSVIISRNSGLKFADRLKLALFSISVSNTKRATLNLAETSYLRKEILSDGEEGYSISSKMSSKLMSLFSDPVILNKDPKIFVKNASGEQDISKTLSETIEVLGAKVSLVENHQMTDDDCIIVANDEYVANKISRLLGCVIEKDEVWNGGFDVQVIIGKKFAKRF